MALLYSLILLLFPTIIAINVLAYTLTVKKALRKFIEPKLRENECAFIDYKWPGLLSNGDFRSNDIAFTDMNKNGNIFNSTFAYIFYKKGNETKKITARIDTAFLITRKVVYSSEF